ncbi:MAG: hypothetical protein ACT4ON_03250 [Bacteroidota bacterium]
MFLFFYKILHYVQNDKMLGFCYVEYFGFAQYKLHRNICGWIFIAFLIFFTSPIKAQELYPHVEPASNIPKGVLGIRLANEGYNEINQFRTQQSLRFMYGFSPKWMATASFNFSNHHGKTLPADFIRNDGNIGYHTHGTQKGKTYPYRFENFNLNVKYRFLSIDGEQSHFRMAAYAEGATGNQAHDEAEPSLMGDNGGIGAGLIVTKLKKRFAVSAAVGGIVPQDYTYKKSDSTLKISYGNALTYSLSMGLLCLPLKYKNYKQTNVNLYAEFIGRSYDGAKIYSNGKEIIIASVPGLEKGNYIEFRPSVQFIFNSKLRMDLSMAYPILNRSYVHPEYVFYFIIQRYFYFK